MGLNFTRGLTALAIAALPPVGLTVTFAVVGADAVYAGNGNGGGNGKENGGGNRGGRSSERGDRGSDDRGSDNRGNGNGQGGGSSDEAWGRGNGNGNGQGAERSANGQGNGNGQGQGGGRSAEDHGQGNGNGQGQGRSGEEHGQGNGRGAVASELKGLNACHASDQGRANANPDSQVGRIATYATAAEQNETARGEWQTAFDAYEAFEAGYQGRSSEDIQDDIDALTSPGEIDEAALGTLEAELAAAEAYESEHDELGAGADADAKKVAYETADLQSQTALSEWQVAEAAYETAETEDETELNTLAADAEVKRLAYEEEAAQKAIALDEWTTAEDAYEAFETTYSYTGRSSDEIRADIDELTAPGAIDAAKLADLEEELAEAQDYEIRRDELFVDAEAKAEVYDAATAEERTALGIASGGRELSDEAVAALRSCLEG